MYIKTHAIQIISTPVKLAKSSTFKYIARMSQQRREKRMRGRRIAALLNIRVARA